MHIADLAVSQRRTYFVSFVSENRVRISQALADRLFRAHEEVFVTYARGEDGTPHLAVTETPGDVAEETRRPRRNQYKTEVYSVRLHALLQAQHGDANDDQRLYWTGRSTENGRWTHYELSAEPIS